MQKRLYGEVNEEAQHDIRDTLARTKQEYATLRQIDVIAEKTPHGAQLLKLDQCGHTPQRDQEAAVLSAISQFVAALA